MSSRCVAWCLPILLLLTPACRRPAADTPSGGAPAAAPATPDDPAAERTEWFVDLAKASGVDFVHFNGMSGALYYPEIMGPGVALLDYDNDEDLDL
jgi:enediyne biosynthesis protein E4